ncbi:MAG TPA: polyprenyl synthetase family protein [Sphaerochaeta sp.]|nr:polyprenyl synthetase family protein [Sphaerochaeta sp.]
MQDFYEDAPVLKQELQSVQATIETTVESAHAFIRTLLRSHVQSGGKMLRPALVLLCSRLGEESDRDQAIKVASVLEMIHLASLAHDDIIDSALKRRGVPTLFAQAGAKQAVLAGDYLLARALSLVSSEESGEVMNAQVVSNALARLCESELEQDAGQGDYFISKTTYFRRIGGKTASLFALSCYAGASIGKLSNLERMICHRIGYAMGMAFQIQDDILDYVGKKEELGKHTGKDLKEGIPTLPLLLALEAEHAMDEQDRKLTALLRAKNKPLTKASVAKAVALVETLGGVQKADSIAQSYKDRALRDIQTLNNQVIAMQLTQLFEKLAVRSG